MRCSACGADNPPGAKFCNGCGAPLSAACASCGHSNAPGSRFCNECGRALTTLTRSSEPAPERASAPPESYTPRHLAEKILAGRDALAGERKQVTVLFADVVGSTELIQGRDPEEAQRLLDGVVQVMMDAVHHYEGTVSRLMGDGLMAMFGAPVAHEDHAVRACYAALGMVDGVRRHGEAARRAHGITPTIRVGLSTGEVVVRTIRDDLHMDYTAMGQTVHLASRMEQLAAPSTAALTAETLALVEGYVQVRSLGLVPIKGLPEPVEAFELMGSGQARTRLQVAAARGLTRFVGRDAEVAALYAALEQAAKGHGQVAALVGEPGVGKSRVVWELTHSHRTESWMVLESGSVSYGKATSYLPVVDLLKSYCRIESRDDARAIREKLLGKLLNLDEGLRPTLPALLSLLDVPVEDPAWELLDPAQRRRQTLDALKRLLLRESREQPLLLVFEDLHWVDSETQALLDGLVESLPTTRVLLLVNYRPEYGHAWGGKTYYTQLRIDPLGAEGADELLAGLLGHDPALASLKTTLLERTGGNPLFLEESVRSLVEIGLLVGERGGYHLSGPLATIRVPATVQAVLAARIDRLPPDARELLQVAAVIGKDVPDALLRAVADRAEDDLHRRLAALQAAEFLYEASLFPELEYTFKHALTHEVAYGSLLQERRKALHARIMEAIERLHADRLAEHVERLAHHALRAERWPEAIDYARSAGRKALGRSAYREALSWFEQALDGLRGVPESRNTQELGLDLRLELHIALASLAMYGRALEYMREAVEIVGALGDRRRQAGVYAAMSECLRSLGRYDEAVKVGQHALKLAEDAGDQAAYAYAMYHLAQTYRARGELRPAVDALRLCVDAPSTAAESRYFELRRTILLFIRPTLAWTLGDLGDFDEAVTYGMDGVRICEESGDPSSVVQARNTLARAYLERGDVERAVPLLEGALDVARTSATVAIFIWSLALRGVAHTLAGQTAQAVSFLEDGVGVADANGIVSNHALWSTWLGEAYLATGRIVDARRTIENALARATAQQERAYRAVALRALGTLAAREEPPAVEEAEQCYREALTLAEELEMRPLQARCRLGLGKLDRRIGRVDEARAELATAISMLREMEMTFWLPEAEAEQTHVIGSAPGNKQTDDR
jgi:class 3 adenylate cyclase/tetratricopeptide (TPR) repeat protein